MIKITEENGITHMSAFGGQVNAEYKKMDVNVFPWEVNSPYGSFRGMCYSGQDAYTLCKHLVLTIIPDGAH